MPMMQMYFHFRIGEYILLKGWLPASLPVYLASLVGVLALAGGYELLRVTRALLFQLAERKESCCLTDEQQAQQSSASLSTDCNCIPPQLFYAAQQWPFSSNHLFSHWHLLQCVLHFVQLFLGFSLMMVAMTYNVPIFVALLFGHCLGYFLAGPLFLGLAEEGRVGGDCCCG